MKSHIQIFKQKPIDFNAKVEVATAYVAVNGKILFLQCSEHEEASQRWAVPGGKIESEETAEQALHRELFEETGILLTANHSIHFVGQLFIRIPEIDYVCHVFKIDLKTEPEILLSTEHLAYTWVSADEAKQLNLMDAAEEALNFYLYDRLY